MCVRVKRQVSNDFTRNTGTITKIPTINVKKTSLGWILVDFLAAQIAYNLADIRLSHFFRRQENLRRIWIIFGGLRV